MNTLTPTASQTSIQVTDNSQVGEVRRYAKRLAELANYDAAAVSNVGIVATELATNLAKHASGGEILLRLADELEQPALEIISIDRGPGMSNLASCLSDGYSTAGTPGGGLGAVARLSQEFDVYTQPAGTVIVARVSNHRRASALQSPFAWGAVSKLAPHEVVCGDGWRIACDDAQLAVIVADGLGHGPAAAEAAAEALGAFAEDPFAPAEVFFRHADARMRGTRGGAVSVATIDTHSRKLIYTGVGNVAGVLLSTQSEHAGTPALRRGLVSHNGTVGVALRKVQSFEYDCPNSGFLVMHSDGIQTRWNLDSYPGVGHRHPVIAASLLTRDYLRGRDDATTVAVRFDFGA